MNVQVIIPEKLSVGDDVQPSQPSSLSNADAVTDSRLASTHPSCTPLSTPLTSTPTQQTSPLAEHIDAVAATETENGSNLSHILPESDRSDMQVVHTVASCAMETGRIDQPNSMNQNVDGRDSRNIDIDINQSNDDHERVIANSNKKSGLGGREASNELVAMDTEEFVGNGDESLEATTGAMEAVVGVDSLAVDDTAHATGAVVCVSFTA